LISDKEMQTESEIELPQSRYIEASEIKTAGNENNGMKLCNCVSRKTIIQANCGLSFPASEDFSYEASNIALTFIQKVSKQR